VPKSSQEGRPPDRSWDADRTFYRLAHWLLGVIESGGKPNHGYGGNRDRDQGAGESKGNSRYVSQSLGEICLKHRRTEINKKTELAGYLDVPFPIRLNPLHHLRTRYNPSRRLETQGRGAEKRKSGSRGLNCSRARVVDERFEDRVGTRGRARGSKLTGLLKRILPKEDFKNNQDTGWKNRTKATRTPEKKASRRETRLLSMAKAEPPRMTHAAEIHSEATRRGDRTGEGLLHFRPA